VIDRVGPDPDNRGWWWVLLIVVAVLALIAIEVVSRLA
jgi:MYXO-CTERM domain-containing protein